MVSVLASSAVYRGFDPRSGQTKDNKHTALRSKSKDWLVLNQNNVSRVERQVYLRTVVSVSHDIAEKLLNWH